MQSSPVLSGIQALPSLASRGLHLVNEILYFRLSIQKVCSDNGSKNNFVTKRIVDEDD